jgi:hypothetical protein
MLYQSELFSNNSSKQNTINEGDNNSAERKPKGETIIVSLKMTKDLLISHKKQSFKLDFENLEIGTTEPVVSQ